MIKRKTSMQESSNIKNLKIDQKKHDMALEFASVVATSDAFDPEVLSYAELKIEDFSHICLLNLADLHFFDQGMSKKRFDMASEFLKNTSNAYGVLSGDTFTVSTLSGASNAHVSKLNNQNATVLGKHLLKNIKSKILFGVGGNHDGEQGSRNRDTNISLTSNVLSAIDVAYFQYNALLKIDVGGYPFCVFVTHGSGKASTKASSLDVIKAKCNTICSRFGVYPNLVLTGHFHADVNGRHLVEVPVYKNGQLVSTKTQELVIESGPAMQRDSEYTTSYNMPTTATNINAFDISFIKNPYFNKENHLTESPIIWKVNKFPVLKNKKDELSSPAKAYMNAYLEPQNLEENLQKYVDSKTFDFDHLLQNIKDFKEEVKTL
ncbi:MAG: hypothetical protein ACI4TI_03570 [Christensenellales bacterium]